MTSIEDINKRTPIIDHERFVGAWIDEHEMGQDIVLVAKQVQVPTDITEYTDAISLDRAGQMPYMKRVLTMPPSVANDYWEKIKSAPQLMGPRVLRTSDDMEEVTRHQRGNYVLVWNTVTEEMLFAWAPVYESEEAFAKHWNIFRYCFETSIIPRDNKIWKLWGVGETSSTGYKRTRNGKVTIQINDYSGGFREHIQDTLGVSKVFISSETPKQRQERMSKEHVKVERHYGDVVRVMSEKFNRPFVFVESVLRRPLEIKYKDLNIDCPLIPKDKSDFKPDTCYQYNRLSFPYDTFIYRSIFNNYTENLTMTEFLSDPYYKELTKEGASLKEFGEKMTELSRL